MTAEIDWISLVSTFAENSAPQAFCKSRMQYIKGVNGLFHSSSDLFKEEIVGFHLVYVLLHLHFPAALKLNYESLKKFSA
jgi:hypothetical protein